MTLLLPIIGWLIFLVLLSFDVETLRRCPTAPATLYWAPEIPIQTTKIVASATSRPVEDHPSSYCTGLELNSIYLKNSCHSRCSLQTPEQHEDLQGVRAAPI